MGNPRHQQLTAWPQRLQLSRRRGFNLQAVSREVNGRAAIRVSRPGRWGNPFEIAAIAAAEGLDRVAAQAEAVRRHCDWLAGTLPPELTPGPAPTTPEAVRDALRGKNLACWCKAGTPCHADLLLRIANG